MTQHQLVLHTPDGRPIPAVWAYRLYAWLLTRMPREEGDWLHQTGEHPISQFLSYDKDTQQTVWTVNLLCAELEERLFYFRRATDNPQGPGAGGAYFPGTGAVPETGGDSVSHPHGI